MDLVDGRDAVNQVGHHLSGQFETQVHPLGTDVEQQIARRGRSVARAAVQRAEGVQIERPRLTEQPIPDVGAERDDARQIATHVARSDSAHQGVEAAAYLPGALSMQGAGLDGQDEEDRGAGLRRVDASLWAGRHLRRTVHRRARRGQGAGYNGGSMFAYVGALTADPAAAEPDQAISVFQVDADSGRLNHVQSVGGLHSPTYLALHPTLPVLYAAERDWPPMGAQSPGTGRLTTLGVNPQDGRLTVLARRTTGAAAHVNVHPDGRYVFAALNRSQRVAAYPVEADGSVGEPSCVVQHTGRGPRPPNQLQAFPHSTFVDRSARRLLCCDLGIDRVMVYDLDEASGQLRPSPFPFAQVSSGAGPRHLAVHPNGRCVYVLNELDSTIAYFGYDQDTSVLTIQQTISALPESFAGQSAAAQILVHPSGRFVYASNRGHDSIAVFGVDADTGKLRLIAHEPSQGERPHNFTLDASGALMLVANQRSGSVVSLRVDAASGRLTPTGHAASLTTPVCVVLSA